MIKEEINKFNIDSTKLNPEKFEKDDDLNGHIDFILFLVILNLGLEIIISKKLTDKN